MKKIICMFLLLIMVTSFAGCKDNKKDTETLQTSGFADFSKTDLSNVDVDLTALSSTMVYSEVYNMMATPDNYKGKVVKMSGKMQVYKGDIRDYYSCVISDATACCQQGMEFMLKGENPKYPSVGTDITVTGVFNTYYEGKDLYCQLENAELG